MKITKTEFIPLEVRGTAPLRISKGATQVIRSIVIRLQTDQGVVGISEAVSCPPGYPEELQEEILAALRFYLQPVLLNQDPQDVHGLRRAMDRSLNGKYWTKAAVVNAVYDLLAKSRKKAVCQFLGGAWQESVPNLEGMAGLDTPQNMAQKAFDFAQRGAAVVKLKVGDAVKADIDRVRAVREAVGDKVGLRVDANSYYGVSEAVEFINKLEDYNPLHVEAPIDKQDLTGLAALRKKVAIPIMSDESVRTPIEAVNLIRLEAVDIIKLKVTKMGFDLAEEILKVASENGKGCLLGHMMELGVAGAAEAHFALAHPELITPHEIGSFRIVGVSEDIINEAVDALPNCFSLAHGYGLGVTLNDQRVEQCRRRWPAIGAD